MKHTVVWNGGAYMKNKVDRTPAWKNGKQYSRKMVLGDLHHNEFKAEYETEVEF